ncbi:autotransporter outer membrane beta-barrel domain-containing protein [Bradyrhizobium sp. SRL28]|uniref:autotransporter domain-containing protein n=1 Tax=Bradyrhizobium sp. SRL28 TaxID=2836178 RepID=UPI001BDE7DC7|nr:autotransporter domain-containing protein [Bradyrhizobium sp. SRL28]MBT1512025.1 autotransporter outer membrane beta-barrel domain-containing protein [Bradyrhizobium sp. SRL28]
MTKVKKLGVAATAAFGLFAISAETAHAQSVQQLVVRNVIENILQNIRDQIQGRRLAPPPGVLRFSAEQAEFDNRNPFGTDDPFRALAYGKSPALYTKAPPPVAPAVPAWLYGINLIGAYDQSQVFGGNIDTATIVGAFDVTKIGIFTASDALTFVATGAHSWSHRFDFDATTPSGSGTLAYTNGGFSTDFTVSASWTSVTSTGLVAAPNSSSISYTGNVQYKFDFPYSIFIEPTAGVTYTEIYTTNFGTKTGDNTEVHAGARIGTEMKWMTYTIQPQLSGAVLKIVDQSGVGLVGGGAIPGLPPVVGAAVADTLGGRGSGKINVIWTPNFSTYVEAHATSLSGTTTVGGQAGLRYTW